MCSHCAVASVQWCCARAWDGGLCRQRGWDSGDAAHAAHAAHAASLPCSRAHAVLFVAEGKDGAKEAGGLQQGHGGGKGRAQDEAASSQHDAGSGATGTAKHGQVDSSPQDQNFPSAEGVDKGGGSALAGAPAVSAPASLLVQGHSHSHSPLSLSLSPSLACSRAVSD